MRRIGLLLTLVTVLIVAMAAPAAAAPGGRSDDNPGADHRAQHDSTSDQPSEQHDSAAVDQSGNGMNRQGGPSTHPGNGWKDPGQDQGSPANTADPDCTGNRTGSPQATNIGACDNPSGAADKPGGQGGFDADKDWNNGCGNDTDFEDDNNGQCRGPHHQPAERPHVPTPPSSNNPPPTPVQPPTPPPHQPPSQPRTNPPSNNPPSNPPTSPPSNPPSNPPTTPPGETSTGNPPSVPPPPVVVGGPVSAEIPVVTPPTPFPADVPVVVTVVRPVSPPNPTTELISGPLPFTGVQHTIDLSAAGLALVALGASLVRYERRRR